MLFRSLDKVEYAYNENNFLLSSVDLPVSSQVVKASEERPYLGITMRLDLVEIAQLLSDENLENVKSKDRAMVVGELSADLMEPMVRLVRLVESPKDIPVMEKLIKKELYYRFLMHEQGTRLREIVFSRGGDYSIARAINWLKENYEKKLHVKDLAKLARMSESAFYVHFKALTSMSPIQFQKLLRLNEAKKLMLVEKMSASDASFNVGYESPTQFSREYKRFFGSSPSKSVKELR